MSLLLVISSTSFAKLLNDLIVSSELALHTLYGCSARLGASLESFLRTFAEDLTSFGMSFSFSRLSTAAARSRISAPLFSTRLAAASIASIASSRLLIQILLSITLLMY